MRDSDPDAVVCPIGDRPLVLGDRAAAERVEGWGAYPAVLSLTRDELPATTHHHPLRDGPGNSQATVRAAIETALDLYDPNGEQLLVHCAAGISRSATIVTTVVAVTEGLQFGAAFGIVTSARSRADPALPLRRQAELYLSRRDDHPQTFDDSALDHDHDDVPPDTVTCAGCLEPIEDLENDLSFTRYDQPIHGSEECHFAVYEHS